MPNNAAVKLRILLGTVFAVLAGVSGLASCGGNMGKPGVPPVIPSVTLVAASDPIAYHDSTTLTWTSKNSSTCISSGGGGTGTTGTINTGALSTTTTYTVTCFDATKTEQGSDSKTITVTPSAITAFSGTPGVSPTTVASINYLTNGAYITISGTSIYDGTYPVSSVSSTSFTIPINFVSTKTGIWKPAGGMIPNCSTSGDTTAITLSNYAPSTYTGVAPLSVFFDASGATMADASKRPFHDIEYRWNFGEDPAVLATLPGTANWTHGSTMGSRNTATGAVANHVFETPGLYTVELSAVDGTHTVSNKCAQILVQNPESVFATTNTVCVSTSGTFNDYCPSGATQVTTSNFNTALSRISGSSKRILFRSGETWTATANGTVSLAGPGYIGKYGPPGAANPIVKATSSVGTIFQISGNDWRIVDLELNGQNNNVTAVGNLYASQLTLLRLNTHNIGTAYATADFSDVDQFCIQDSVVDTITSGVPKGGYLVAWIFAKRFSFQGNLADSKGGGEHVLRFPKLIKAVVSNNDLKNAAPQKHLIKLHQANPYSNQALWDGTYSEKIIIADNYLPGTTGDDWTVAIAPQNSPYDEHLRDIIIERNWMPSGSATQIALYISATDTTIRNNIIDLTNAAYHIGINISRRSTEPPPNNVKVYNNTIYSASTGNFMAVQIDTTATNTTVINNLGSAPSASGPVMINGTGASGLVQSKNLLNNSPSTLFVNAPPTASADFRLKTGSPALNNGQTNSNLTPVPVFSDYLLTLSPLFYSPINIGAYQGPGL